MTARGVSGVVIRDALTQLLASGPAPVRELVTAVYHRTGDDRVSYGNVTAALRLMEASRAARRTADGMWEAVPS